MAGKENGLTKAQSREQEKRVMKDMVMVAALHKCAIADRCESLPISPLQSDYEQNKRTRDVFNMVEADLRDAGEKLLRRLGAKQATITRVMEEYSNRVDWQNNVE